MQIDSDRRLKIAASCLIFWLGLFTSSAAPAIDSTILPPPPDGKAWQLAWSDEFDGEALDLSKWQYAKDQDRKLRRWRQRNISLDGAGHLIISITAEGGYAIAGEINTRRTYTPTGGFFVARCKLPFFPGTRPAFWLQSEKINSINDPTNPTEIDVLEAPTRDGRIYLNLHWDGYESMHRTTGVIAPTLIDLGKYHDFAVWWDSNEYKFYIDGALMWTTSGGGVSTGPEFMRLSVEPVAKDPKLPQHIAKIAQAGGDEFIVDYVRVYQLVTP